jgi:hypothetical protein
LDPLNKKTQLWQPIVALLTLATAPAASQSIQVPDVIKQQAAEIQDKFTMVLEQECEINVCFPVGCQVSRFDTLDEKQTSSLPGLDEVPTKMAPQYKLASVLCEFTHEPTLDQEHLASLRQRLIQKVKKVGVAVSVMARPLKPKMDESSPEEAPLNLDQGYFNSLWIAVLPFLPWLLVALVLTCVFLVLIWGLRRLGKPKKRLPIRDRLTGKPVKGEDADPTPHMILTRVGQLKEQLLAEEKLIELALKKPIDEDNLDELALILHHFGPDLLKGLREKSEYREALGRLSKHYSDRNFDETLAEVWLFLNRFERSVTAARVRIDSQPLEDEFNFLGSLEVDEFLGIIRELNESEAIVAVSHAPKSLRERFFAHANPAFTAKFVEHLTKVEKNPDGFVRDVARRLRSIYLEKGATLRTIKVDKIPLLEQALNSMEPGKRRELVSELGKSNPSFVSSLTPTVFMDDSLPLFADEVLTEIFLSISPQEAADYLSTFAWGNDLILRLNPRIGDSIRKIINFHMPNASGLATHARKKISDFVKRQDSAGKLDLRSINLKVIGGSEK